VEQFKANVNKFIQSTVTSTAVQWTGRGGGREWSCDWARIHPEASYFRVKLVEMRLAEGGKYFVDFFAVRCLRRRIHIRDRTATRSNVLSNETVKQMLGDTGGTVGHVRFTNIPNRPTRPDEAG